MNLTKSIAAAVAATMTFGILPAAPAHAQTSVQISYRDYDGRNYRRDDRRDYRRDYRRSWDRDRDGIPNRYDRRDNRRNWGYNSGYGYRDARRCWTKWRYDRRRDERVRVRYCR
jgi:hypothetical protein